MASRDLTDSEMVALQPNWGSGGSFCTLLSLQATHPVWRHAMLQAQHLGRQAVTLLRVGLLITMHRSSDTRLQRELHQTCTTVSEVKGGGLRSRTNDSLNGYQLYCLTAGKIARTLMTYESTPSASQPGRVASTPTTGKSANVVRKRWISPAPSSRLLFVH